MRKRLFILSLLIFLFAPGWAQTLRSGVVVFGNGPAAYAAAIQSARSGVKTLLVADKISWNAAGNIGNKPELNYGLWAEIAKKYPALTNNFQPDSAGSILQGIADTVKNLSREKSAFLGLKASGKGWEIRLSNGRKVKTEMVVDAAEQHPVLHQLQVVAGTAPAIDPLKEHLLSRTSIAALDSGRILPLRALISEKERRVVLLPVLPSVVESVHAGQAAGATAAFCAFFDTDTKHLNTRLIQNELLSYRSSLFPFGDVLPADTNFVRIQHLAVSGLLKHGLKQNKGRLWFDNEGVLTADELKEDMKSYYSRSQIWFADHPVDTLSVEGAINLLMYTATRGEELRREVERGWKSSLGFSSSYETKRAVSRREFAVLADIYLQPFAARIDINGELIN